LSAGAPVLDLRPLIEAIERTLQSHDLGRPGAYRRWKSELPGVERDLGLNPYGCADAANILYTIGRFPRSPVERGAWVETLQGLQDSESGLFREGTHHEIHTTAHCLAALELFDAGPRHALKDLQPLREPAAMERFLDDLDWSGGPWTESHRGAGLYAALWLAGETSAEWEDRYFVWLRRECDPDTGLWRKGAIPSLDEKGEALFPHLAGTFHYLFDHEHARRPIPHPEALIDTCLAIAERRLFPLCTFVGFAEIDWVYCLSRSARQTAHRFDETRAALRGMAERLVAFLSSLDPDSHDGWNDLHSLFGALCALAELQQALPGALHSARPLRLVLDRRPFI
jgi:hypothetical protein